MTSSRVEQSSPITCIAPPQHGQPAAPGTPLLRPGALQRRLGLLLFGLALGHRLFEIFQRQVELVGIEPFRAPAKLHPLQLADQVAQAIVLPGELVALFQEPPLLRRLSLSKGRHRARPTPSAPGCAAPRWCREGPLASSQPALSHDAGAMGSSAPR